MGRAMSTAFGNFGKLMQTKAFQEGFSGLLRNGVQFANIVLPAFAIFLQQLGRLGGEGCCHRPVEPARRVRPHADRAG